MTQQQGCSKKNHEPKKRYGERVVYKTLRTYVPDPSTGVGRNGEPMTAVVYVCECECGEGWELHVFDVDPEGLLRTGPHEVRA